MNGKELVRRAVRRQSPERVPVGNLVVDVYKWDGTGREHELDEIYALLGELPKDLLNIYPGAAPGFKPRDGGNGVLYDEWGVGWFARESRVVFHPMESSYDEVESYPYPKADISERYDNIRKLKEENPDSYILATVWFTLFERMWFLRGMENLLVDPYLEFENFVKLRDRVMEFNLKAIDSLLKVGVDGIYFSDDWGTQRGLLINPEDWRKYYRGCYKLMFDRVHAGGADVWMHLCGNIFDILPDLVELGLDVYNPVQPQAMDVNRLQKEFGNSLSFNGGIDVQHTLPHGTPEDVEKEIDMLVSLLGSGGGGYIIGTSHTVLPDTSIENIRAMIKAVKKHTGTR